ncbi:peptidase S41 [Desulfarculus baarsii DSM 2075]|uniref:Peptidase S41 n=1 Tax=Desulfarculus baarsii (strain ATCC 33931 / DSM 2075 / LMG 7858 / VKM B-1802 / 2st14) TaxID=644282 RepID=E1QGZ6_DESB2|nr:S41 family peptidase [Desulfarculus baarsii]ADK84839.1 peptidase S41 [Desulfarculus baarsii DSM 2075]
MFRLKLIVVALCLSAFSWAQAAADDLAWTSDRAALLFYEAMTALQKNALRPPAPLDEARRAIGAAARGLDEFSAYWPREEYEAFKRAADPSFAGVGMEIWADESGAVICIPKPGGPAQKAGVAYGDRLISVDGKPVAAEAVYAAGAMIRGQAGSTVRLGLLGQGGRRKNVSIIRAKQAFRTVESTREGGAPRLRISSFTNNTPAELAEALGRLGAAKVVVIDLRGNVGGDMFAAMEAAGKLLPVGAPLLTLRQRGGETAYKNVGRPLNLTSRLFVWQDKRTASAAEVFVAALTRNKRATSIGQTSFGKGVAQKIVELSDGSALLVTYAELIPPGGRAYHGHGLRPDRALAPGADASDRAYALATAAAMSAK